MKIKNIAHFTSLLRSFGYFAILGLFGLITSSLGPVLPDLSIQVSTPLNVVSIVFTARAFGFLFGSLLGGKLLDRYKSHPLFAVSFLLMSLATIYLPFSTIMWQLTLGVFFQGICLGFVVVGASTLIVWEHAENPGPWLNTQGFINGMGGFFSPLIISFVIARYGSYSFSYWFFAALACVLAAFFLYVRSPKIRTLEEKETREEDTHTNGLVYLVAVIFLLYVGAEVSFNGWVFTIATTAYSISAANACLLNSIFWGSMAVGRVIGIPISKKIPAEKILFISYTGSVVSLLVTILFPGSTSVLWGGTIGMGLFMATIFSSLLMYTEKQMHLSGKKTSIFFSATSVGGMLLPWVSGQIFTLFSPHAVKGVVLVCFLCGLALFLYITKNIDSKKFLTKTNK
ncbi:MAG: MFS transporter [Pelolinea sp.]|nr:MFS transporter [Pelolinea sp.]